jgi:hypothetical protein
MEHDGSLIRAQKTKPSNMSAPAVCNGAAGARLAAAGAVAAVTSGNIKSNGGSAASDPDGVALSEQYGELRVDAGRLCSSIVRR